MCIDLLMYKSVFMEVNIMHHMQDNRPGSYLKARADGGNVTRSVNYPAEICNGSSL